MCGALGYREAHIRLRGLATVVGDHQGGGVGALREIAGGLYAVGSGFACLDGRYRTAQNEGSDEGFLPISAALLTVTSALPVLLTVKFLAAGTL